MNASNLDKIRSFIDEVLRPTFSGIEQMLKTQTQYSVLIVSNACTGNDAVDNMLRQMYPDKPYLSQHLNDTLSAQQWLGESLYVEISQNSTIESTCVGQFCLSAEFTVTTTEQLQLILVTAWMQPDTAAIEIQTHSKADSLVPLALEAIDGSDIQLQFAESFERFETQLLNQSIALEEFQDLAPNITSFDVEQAPQLDETTQIDETTQTNLNEDLNEAVENPETAQTTFMLQQKAKQLSEQLSPPGFPVFSKQHVSPTAPTQIKAVQNRIGHKTDLRLEYSPSTSESELIEYLSRLGHYQSFKYLAHLHLFVQEDMNSWLKQNGQPSLGAIAPHLQQAITEFSEQLQNRIQFLTNSQLESLTALDLQIELNDLRSQHQQQQTLLEHLAQSSILGYLDASLIKQNIVLQTVNPFTDPNNPIDVQAKHLTHKAGSPIISLVTSCHSKTYQTYIQRHPHDPSLKRLIQYTLTQKLYPKRPTFSGPAPKAIYPRLELLWGQTDEPTLPQNPLTQIWCVYPMLRSDSTQWLIVAATSDTQPLRTIPLKNGQLAQEGTLAYLERSLTLMGQSEDEYTHTLSKLVCEALEHQCVKYLHLHQTQDLQTGEPRDIVQLQFHLLQ